MRAALLILVLSSFSFCDAGRILAVFPVQGKSHTILIESVLERLARRGNEVVHITPNPRVGLPDIPNYSEIDISSIYIEERFNSFAFRNQSGWTLMKKMGNMMEGISRDIIQHPKIVSLIQSENQHFDLILGDNMFSHATMCGFAYKFKAALAVVHSFNANAFAKSLTGNPFSLSYIPEPLSGLSKITTLVERLKNTALGIGMFYATKLFYIPMHDRQMHEAFGKDLPHIEDILHNTSLVLLNQHHALHQPQPLLPNMVEVLGMHVRRPTILPKLVKEYLDESSEGVILFSLGSLAKSADMGEERINEFLKAFSQLKMKVLWKFEKDDMPLKPDNVMIWKWLPQNTVLAHPHVKLFITHGGLLSMTETIYRKVPFIGIPIGGDQNDNVNLAEQLHIGKKIDLDTFTAEQLVGAINEILNDPSYRRNIEEKSDLIQDGPMIPRDKAVWWIEFVMRHKNTNILRSAALDLSIIQLLSLDVIAALSIISILFLVVSIRIVKSLYKCFSKKKQD